MQRIIEQPVRAFVEAKTVTLAADPRRDRVSFRHTHTSRGFDLDIEHARRLHAVLGLFSRTSIAAGKSARASHLDPSDSRPGSTSNTKS